MQLLHHNSKLVSTEVFAGGWIHKRAFIDRDTVLSPMYNTYSRGHVFSLSYTKLPGKAQSSGKDIPAIIGVLTDARKVVQDIIDRPPTNQEIAMSRYGTSYRYHNDVDYLSAKPNAPAKELAYIDKLLQDIEAGKLTYKGVAPGINFRGKIGGDGKMVHKTTAPRALTYCSACGVYITEDINWFAYVRRHDQNSSVGEYRLCVFCAAAIGEQAQAALAQLQKKDPSLIREYKSKLFTRKL